MKERKDGRKTRKRKRKRKTTGKRAKTLENQGFFEVVSFVFFLWVFRG